MTRPDGLGLLEGQSDMEREEQCQTGERYGRLHVLFLWRCVCVAERERVDDGHVRKKPATADLPACINSGLGVQTHRGGGYDDMIQADLSGGSMYHMYNTNQAEKAISGIQVVLGSKGTHRLHIVFKTMCQHAFGGFRLPQGSWPTTPIKAQKE